MYNQAQKVNRILPLRLIVFTLKSMDNIASFFVSLKIRPNTLTFMALLSGMGAGLFYALREPVWGGVFLILCGIFDILDGKVALKTNQNSLFGAIFDSTLDRYSEFFIYLGLAFHFRHHWAIWIIFWTFLGSTMVSYTRARAEGLGIECKIGVMQRAERMVILTLGTFIGALLKIFDPLMIIALGIIALVSNITVFQRTFYIKKAEKSKKTGKEEKQNEQD